VPEDGIMKVAHKRAIVGVAGVLGHVGSLGRMAGE
jgi:hypothetical protein